MPSHYVKGVKDGTARIFVHGVIVYEDFLTDAAHVTRYCFSLWYNQFITGTTISSSPCGRQTNCTDEECEDYQQLKTLVAPRE